VVDPKGGILARGGRQDLTQELIGTVGRRLIDLVGCDGHRALVQRAGQLAAQDDVRETSDALLAHLLGLVDELLGPEISEGLVEQSRTRSVEH
jgi:hypothetical protein